MSKSKSTDIVTIALLGALGVGGFLIFKNRKEIGNFFGGIGEGVQDFTDGVGKWYGDTIEGIQKGVDDVGKNVGDFFGGIFNDIGSSYVNFFGGIGKGLQDTVTGIQSGVDDFTKGAGDFFGGIAQGVTDFFSGKRVTEDAPTTKAPEETKTPIMQGSPSSQDLSKYKVENKSLYDSIYGEGNYEVVGAPSALTKEEKEKLPTKTTAELAKGTSFISRVFSYAKSKL